MGLQGNNWAQRHKKEIEKRRRGPKQGAKGGLDGQRAERVNWAQLGSIEPEFLFIYLFKFILDSFYFLDLFYF